MNIDGDAAQMTLGDCLYLTDTQQLMAESASYTQSVLGALDAQVAISYNPTLDYWPGTATPRVDPKDAVYCVNYVVKRWRFVYNASIACGGVSGTITLELAGGKVGDEDQAEYYVPSPSAGTEVQAIVSTSCGGQPRVDSNVLLEPTGGTSPFTGVVVGAAGCTVWLTGYEVSL